ncbi:MAG: CDP-alcohol phosphatidyltransferase family protein [Chloroflexi bacterium]|nr:CDP-alcohol phosphatidyltransferase family protein [Chloroflexota bacterium]
MTISNDTRTRVKAVGEPIALFLGRLGLTPDALTLIGFGITAVGAILLWNQLWIAGGLVVFAGGVFDMFDGTLARATGRATRLGAFMDSVFDRWGEALVYVGLVAGLAIAGWADGPVVAAAAMASAFLVSYARAKAEGLGFSAGTGMAAVGLMPREVRLVILCGGLVLGGLLGTEVVTVGQGAGGGAIPVGILVIEGALAIIALGATVTVAQRVLHTRAEARRQARADARDAGAGAISAAPPQATPAAPPATRPTTTTEGPDHTS